MKLDRHVHATPEGDLFGVVVFLIVFGTLLLQLGLQVGDLSRRMTAVEAKVTTLEAR